MKKMWTKQQQQQHSRSWWFNSLNCSPYLCLCAPVHQMSSTVLSLRAFGDVDWSACGTQVVRRGRGKATGRA